MKIKQNNSWKKHHGGKEAEMMGTGPQKWEDEEGGKQLE